MVLTGYLSVFPNIKCRLKGDGAKFVPSPRGNHGFRGIGLQDAFFGWQLWRFGRRRVLQIFRFIVLLSMSAIHTKRIFQPGIYFLLNNRLWPLSSGIGLRPWLAFRHG